jgi:hypothetical protein
VIIGLDRAIDDRYLRPAPRQQHRGRTAIANPIGL